MCERLLLRRWRCGPRSNIGRLLQRHRRISSRSRKNKQEGKIKKDKVAVIGAGSWGTALAKVLHTNGSQVTVWSIVEAEIAMLRERHEHVDKLPGEALPEDINFSRI